MAMTAIYTYTHIYTMGHYFIHIKVHKNKILKKSQKLPKKKKRHHIRG
jgi:hypothetical protein